MLAAQKELDFISLFPLFQRFEGKDECEGREIDTQQRDAFCL